MLSAFGYHLYGIVDHPHRYILFFIKVIHIPFPESQKLGFGSLLAQRAWNILNDRYSFLPAMTHSQQLPLCVAYSSNAIACAAIYLAAMCLLACPMTYRTLELPLPAVEWWELFDCTAEAIQAITQHIITLYQRGRIVWLDDVDPLSVNRRCSFTTLGESVVVSPVVEAQGPMYVAGAASEV